ncbi:MAG: radical SAM protein [Phycisphaerae bacterium]|nr:radical SAM protein [Phycisphaerae bacterium]
MNGTFVITTLGCKVNQYDGAAVGQSLRQAGLVAAPRGAACDVAVVNTCCVTAPAMYKSRQAIRRAFRRADRAVLICGCYGDFDAPACRELATELVPPGCRVFIAGHGDDLPQAIADIVEMLCGEAQRDAGVSPACLAGILPAPDCGTDSTPSADQPNGIHNAGETPASRCASPAPHNLKSRRLAVVARNAPADARLPAIEHFDDHQRAFVKIQDGCDAFCSYCVVPFTRSVVWSRPAEAVLAECRRLVKGGHREIVLSGVFLGAYGRSTCCRRRWDDTPSPLGPLIEAVASIAGLWRVRLSSLEPGDLTAELLDVAKRCPNFAPHFHLPLQSGADTVLARMNRQYDSAGFLRVVERLRQAMDRPALTADVIVGFPGETDAEFERTLRVAGEAGFAAMHIFPFSAIPGTAAWAMRRRGPNEAVVQRRVRELTVLGESLSQKYRRQFLGQTLEGVVEIPSRDTVRRRAMTDRHVTIFFDPPPVGPEELTGQVRQFHILDDGDGGLVGRLTS